MPKPHQESVQLEQLGVFPNLLAYARYFDSGFVLKWHVARSASISCFGIGWPIADCVEGVGAPKGHNDFSGLFILIKRSIKSPCT